MVNLNQLRKGLTDVVNDTFDTAKKITRAKVGEYLKDIAAYSQGADAADIASRYLANGTTTISDADGEKAGEYLSLLQKAVSVNKRLKDAREKAKEVPGLKRRVTSLEGAKTRLQNQLENQKTKYERKIAELEKEHKREAYILDAIEQLRKKPLRVYEKAVKYMDEEGQEPQKESLNEFEKLKAITMYEGKPTQATNILYDILCEVILRDGVREASEQFIEDIKAILEGKSPDDDSGNGSDDNEAKKPKGKNAKKKH